MRAALFDLDETILDRSGSLRDFVTWQATGMLCSSINNTTLFVERFIELDQKGMVWKDKVYASLIDEFKITNWSVDELLNVYLLTFCTFSKPRNGALAAIEEFRSNGFRIGIQTSIRRIIFTLASLSISQVAVKNLDRWLGCHI